MAGVAAPAFWVAGLGTELRPEMLDLTGFQYRLLDSLLLGSVAGAFAGWGRTIRPPETGAALLLGAIVVAMIATPFGTPRSAGSTVHQLLVAGSAYVLAARLVGQEDGARKLVALLVMAGGLAGGKALGIWLLADDITGGPDSLVQARSRIEPGVLSRRVLLVGGAPFALVAVPLGIGYALGCGRRGAWALFVLPLAGFAVLVSLTRANLAACAIACVLVAALVLRDRSRRIRGRPSALVIAVSVIWIGGVALTWQTTSTPLEGALERTTSKESRSVSTTFRVEEAEAVLDSLAGAEWIVGKGLGGTFLFDAPGLDPRGNTYVHNWPLWIVLKSGLVGLALVAAGLFLTVWRLLARPELWSRLLGVSAVSLLLAWLAVNALPLAEGELLIGMLVAAGAAAARQGPARSSPGSARRSAPT